MLPKYAKRNFPRPFHNLTPYCNKKLFLQNSRNTQRSKSSKNRRKHEKKKYSTREGSSFEDIGLIAAQHEVISAVYDSVEDVGLLNRCSIQLNFNRLFNRIFNAHTTGDLEVCGVDLELKDTHKNSGEKYIC